MFTLRKSRLATAWFLGLVASVALSLSACGGGGVSPQLDGTSQLQSVFQPHPHKVPCEDSCGNPGGGGGGRRFPL